MSRKAWQLAVVILAAGAIATADAGSAIPTARTADAGPRPASADQICSDVQVGKTFGGDTNGCHQYLDACLSELTESQRAEWRRSVDACVSSESGLYACYAEVPWC